MNKFIKTLEEALEAPDLPDEDKWGAPDNYLDVSVAYDNSETDRWDNVRCIERVVGWVMKKFGYVTNWEVDYPTEAIATKYEDGKEVVTRLEASLVMDMPYGGEDIVDFTNNFKDIIKLEGPGNVTIRGMEIGEN